MNIPGFKIRQSKEDNYKAIFNEKTGQTIRIAVSKDPVKPLRYPELLDVSFGTKCLANCFIEGTPILIYNKEESSIENINIGDEIISYNEKTGEFEKDIVDFIYDKFYEGEVIILELENSKIIKCTPEHPFLTQRGWIEAKNLLETDDLKDM